MTWKFKCFGEIINSVNDSNYDLENDINNVFSTFSNKKQISLVVGQVQSGKTNKIFRIIDDSFNKHNFDIIILLCGTTNLLYSQTIDRFENDLLPNLKNIKNLKYLKNENIKNSVCNDHSKYIITTLKQKDYLSEIYNFLYSIKYRQNKKILVIDDESDFGSTNNNNDSESKIYSLIKKIYKIIDYGYLLFVTATPFANIISRNSSDMFPNQIICWSTSNKYTGLKFFNEHKNEIYKIINSTKYDDESKLTEEIWDSLDYFLKTYIDNYDNLSKLEEISLLYNIDINCDKHNKVKEILEKRIRYIKNNTKSHCEKLFNNDLKNFYSLKKIIHDDIELIVLNKNTVSNFQKKKINIYIGGNLISRGNTFKNLIVEFFVNVSKNKISIDTLLQRCRWFGYRLDVYKYMKIYINQTTMDALIEAQKYIDTLTEGIHNPENLFRKIEALDERSINVQSTGKE